MGSQRPVYIQAVVLEFLVLKYHIAVSNILPNLKFNLMVYS